MKMRIAVALLVLAAAWQGADACGPWFLVRPALQATFWQPSTRGAAELLDGSARVGPVQPYAGMGGGSPALRAASEAYRVVARWRENPPVWWDDGSGGHDDRSLSPALASAVRRAVESGLAGHPPAAEAEELRLIGCKLGLREAESAAMVEKGQGERGSPARVRAGYEKARDALSAFAAEARTPALASEARGWLARCHFLLGEPHRAARLYLDELARPDSAQSRETLLASLRILFPYNGSAARLADHLDAYFDTPQHALFALDLVTNPVVNDEDERRAMADVGQKALAALDRHRELFAKGDDGARLALAAMRASLYRGDPARALALAEALPPGAPAASEPEARWMRGVAHFLLKQYAAAEPHLLAVATAAEAPDEPRGRARLGLVAVYQKLDRPVDQLLAALRYEAGSASGAKPSAPDAQWDVGWSPDLGDWLLDISYLIDVQLTDAQLGEARQALAQGPALKIDWNGTRTDPRRLVDYALAVRAARGGDYAAAAALYTRIGATQRAARMKQADRACGPQTAPDLERRYGCAAFLAAHPARIFFNDTLWEGYQRYALLRSLDGDDARAKPTLLDEGERQRLLENERRFQDAQEERWHAFQMFDGVAQEAGRTALGRRAAQGALECLARLEDGGRFGREADIAAARKRLAGWLRATPPDPT